MACDFFGSYEHHPVEDIEPLSENGHAIDGLMAIERLLLFLSDTQHVGYQIDCLLLVTGAGYKDGITEMDVAKKWGCTKQAVSKRCRELRGHFDLPPGPGMRSDASKQSFRNANRRNLPKL